MSDEKEPKTVRVRYVGGHEEVRSALSGLWRRNEEKDLPPEVAEGHLSTVQFKRVTISKKKGGK